MKLDTLYATEEVQFTRVRITRVRDRVVSGRDVHPSDFGWIIQSAEGTGMGDTMDRALDDWIDDVHRVDDVPRARRTKTT